MDFSLLEPAEASFVVNNFSGAEYSLPERIAEDYSRPETITSINPYFGENNGLRDFSIGKFRNEEALESGFRFSPRYLSPRERVRRRIQAIGDAIMNAGLVDVQAIDEDRGMDEVIAVKPRPEPALPTDVDAQAVGKQRAAQRYRRGRVRESALDDTISDIMATDGARDLMRAFMRRRHQIQDKVQRRGERHAMLAPYMSILMTRPEFRAPVMRALDESATAESDRLKSGGSFMDVDVAIVGGGPQAAVLSAALRAHLPDAAIVGVDRRPLLGGQFRGYGGSDQRPVHLLNSRNYRPEDMGAIGLPGGDGNLNSFGRLAPFQIPYATAETYVTNLDAGDTAAANQFVSAPTILGMEALDIQESLGGRSLVCLQDPDTGATLYLNARQVAVVAGAGERQQFKDVTAPGFLSAEAFLSHFADPTNRFPMDKFVGKRIAVLGGGDSGRVVNEILTWLGPREAYGSSVVQFGGPREIYWYGTDFEDREGFCATNRSRYRQLASYIRSTRDYRTGLIAPFPLKATNIEEFDADRVGVSVDGGNGFAIFDYVIDATPLQPNLPAGLQREFDTATSVYDYLPEVNVANAPIGLRSPRGSWFLGGVARQPLTGRERETFADGIKENTFAFWANTPRILAAERMITRALELAA